MNRSTRYLLPLLCLMCVFNMGFLFGSSNLDIVKDTKITSRLSLGEILDNYKYVKEGKWTEQKSSKGDEFVEYKAMLTSAGLVKSFFGDKIDLSEPGLADYVDTFPTPLYLVGRFIVSDGKVKDNIIQITDDTDKIHVPMSIPMSVFQNNQPIPETFLFGDSARIYQLKLTEFFFKKNYPDGLAAYGILHQSAGGKTGLPVEIKVETFKFGGIDNPIELHGELMIMDVPLIFSSYTENGKRYNTVSGIVYDNYQEFSNLQKDWSPLLQTSLFKNSKSLYKEPVTLLSRPGSKSFSPKLGSQLPFSLGYSLQSFTPFQCKWYLTMDSDYIQTLPPEVKTSVQAILKQASSPLAKLIYSSPDFGKLKNFEIKYDGKASGNRFSEPSQGKVELTVNYPPAENGEYPITIKLFDEKGRQLCVADGQCKAEYAELLCDYKEEQGRSSSFSFLADPTFNLNSPLNMCGMNFPYVSMSLISTKGIASHSVESQDGSAPDIADKSASSVKEQQAETAPGLIYGIYASFEKGGPTIVLYQDETGQMVFEKRVANLSWSKKGNNIEAILQWPDSDREPITVTGKFQNNADLELDNHLFIKGSGKAAYEYKFAEDMDGQLAIADVSSNHSRFIVKIETASPQDNGFVPTCNVNAICKKRDNALICTQDVDEDSREEFELNGQEAIVIKGFPGTAINVESTYPTGLNCGMCEYTGKYQFVR